MLHVRPPSALVRSSAPPSAPVAHVATRPFAGAEAPTKPPVPRNVAQCRPLSEVSSAPGPSDTMPCHRPCHAFEPVDVRPGGCEDQGAPGRTGPKAGHARKPSDPGPRLGQWARASAIAARPVYSASSRQGSRRASRSGPRTSSRVVLAQGSGEMIEAVDARTTPQAQASAGRLPVRWQMSRTREPAAALTDRPTVLDAEAR